jgi:hypothetical protein
MKSPELTSRCIREAAKLDEFKISVGDKQGVLEGTRLDEVKGFEMNGTQFAPEKLRASIERDVLAPGCGGDRVDVVSGEPESDGARSVEGMVECWICRPACSRRGRESLVSKSVQAGATHYGNKVGRSGAAGARWEDLVFCQVGNAGKIRARRKN